MSSTQTPPNGGTREVPLTAVASEGDQLYELAKASACPQCGDNIPLDLVRVVAPEDSTEQTAETYKGVLKGAAGGGLAGAPFGPPGVLVAGVFGAVVGADHGHSKGLKKKLRGQCPICPHDGKVD